MAKKPTRPQYGVHPAVEMMQKFVAGLKAKTGRTLPEWVSHIQKDGPDDEKICRSWLKQEHGFGTNHAHWLAKQALGKDLGIADYDPEAYLRQAAQYVDAMFSGAKASLRPIYDELLQIGLAIGADVKACPGTTIVPLYRHHVFAQLKPTTNTRLDLGLALGDRKTPKRLIDTGGFAKKDRITRRIGLTAPAEIDDEVRHWLKEAYDLDA